MTKSFKTSTNWINYTARGIILITQYLFVVVLFVYEYRLKLKMGSLKTTDQLSFLKSIGPYISSAIAVLTALTTIYIQQLINHHKEKIERARIVRIIKTEFEENQRRLKTLNKSKKVSPKDLLEGAVRCIDAHDWNSLRVKLASEDLLTLSYIRNAYSAYNDAKNFADVKGLEVWQQEWNIFLDKFEVK